MKQKRFKAKAILVFLCSVGLFLTTLCAFRSPLTFLLLDKVVIPFVEQSVEGINAGIGRIEITSFSRVDLHDLSLKYHPSGQAGYDFTIPQVRLSFDPTDLFRGVDNFLQTFKLEAGAGECIVNMPPGPSVDKNTSTSGFSSLPWLPEVVPTIELQNWRVVVRSKREEWSLSDIDIQGGKQLSKPLHLKGKALFKQVIVQLAARVEPSDALLTLKAENDPASTFIFRSEATFSFDPAQPVDGTGKFNLEYGNGRIFDHRVDHLSLSGMVGKRKLRLDNASLEGKNEQLSVQRFVLPLDLLFSGEIAGAIAKGEGELTLSLSEPAAYIPYIPPEYHNAYLNSRLEKLNLIVKLRDGSLVIDTARLSGADFEIQLTDGVLKPSGGTTSWDAVEINLPWLIEIGEMAAISTLLDKKVSLAGGLSAQGTLTGTFAEPSFTYSLSATALRYGSLPIGNVEARGKGDSHGITLDTLQIISEAGRLEGSGGYDFASRCFLPTVIDCNLTNLKPYGEFVGQELDGDIRLRLRLDGALTAPRGTAFIDVDHLAYGTTSLRDMHLESSLAGDLIAVKQLRLRYNDNLSVETSGRLNRKPTGALLTLEHLTINHPVTKAELVKEATLFFSGDTLQIEDTLRMVTDVGYVELGGRLGKEDGDFAISGSFCGDRDLIR
ncbi:MAG: hypothetical protein OEV64_09695, partial [Desulfobulbaceae bacterium]|nr:hypothetical protein [Desulfobulbaceae bacterium]